MYIYIYTCISRPTPRCAHMLTHISKYNNMTQVAYVIVAKDCATPDKCDGVTPTQFSGMKVDSQGKLLVTRKYDTSKNGINMYRFSSLFEHLSGQLKMTYLSLVQVQ